MRDLEEAFQHAPLSGVSRETRDRLELFATLLRKWTKKINLISPSTTPHIWSRHILDSAQLVAYGSSAMNWVDLGSGGGLPGVVVAALLAEQQPDARVTLVESDGRKIAFLFESARAMELDISIEHRRIEDHAQPVFDVVSARALAPLPQLLALASPYLAPTGRCLFLKGETLESELTSVASHWHMKATTHRSLTDPRARILCVEELAHV